MASPASARPSATAAATSASVRPRFGKLEIVQPKTRLAQQLDQQRQRAGPVLAADDTAAGKVGDTGELQRVAGRHDQSLLAARPLDQHHRLAGQGLLDVLDVPAASALLRQVQAGHLRVRARQALEARQAAAEAHGKVRARPRATPSRAAVVAARQMLDGAAVLGATPVLGMAGEPGVDQAARKQQLAGNPYARDPPGGDQVVNLALLEADQIGDLARGHGLLPAWARPSA